MKSVPPAPLDFAINGTHPTREFRVRNAWFGFAVLEHKIIHRDGGVTWRRYPSWRGPILIGEIAQSSPSPTISSITPPPPEV